MIAICAECKHCLLTATYPMCSMVALRHPVSSGKQAYQRCSDVNSQGACVNIQEGSLGVTLGRALC